MIADARKQPRGADRGYLRLYIDHVQQADRGCDLDFLVGCSGAPVPRRPFLTSALEAGDVEEIAKRGARRVEAVK